MANPKNKGKGKGIQFLRDHAADEDGPCLIWPFARDSLNGDGFVAYMGRSRKAHRVMCDLVNGPPPTPLHQAAHSCGNRHLGCVHPKHLSWKTNSENQLDRRRHGTAGKGPKGNARHRLTADQVAEIRSGAVKRTQKEWADLFGVSFQTIGFVIRGQTWKGSTYANGEQTPVLMTDELREQIIAFRQSGNDIGKTAKHFKIARGRVIEVLRGANLLAA